jgi:hypothetical protein
MPPAPEIDKVTRAEAVRRLGVPPKDVKTMGEVGLFEVTQSTTTGGRQVWNVALPRDQKALLAQLGRTVCSLERNRRGSEPSPVGKPEYPQRGSSAITPARDPEWRYRAIARLAEAIILLLKDWTQVSDRSAVLDPQIVNETNPTEPSGHRTDTRPGQSMDRPPARTGRIVFSVFTWSIILAAIAATVVLATWAAQSISLLP